MAKRSPATILVLPRSNGLRSRRGDVHLCAFDLVELDGRDLRLEPLAVRRRLLARLVRKPRSGLVLNAQFELDGPLLFEPACALGGEGIVSKRKGSRYRSGRSQDWVKTRTRRHRRCGDTRGHARTARKGGGRPEGRM